MDEIEDLYKQFTMKLPSNPIPEHEVRGITLESFRAVIEQERHRAFSWGMESQPELDILEALV